MIEVALLVSVLLMFLCAIAWLIGTVTHLVERVTRLESQPQVNVKQPPTMLDGGPRQVRRNVLGG